MHVFATFAPCVLLTFLYVCYLIVSNCYYIHSFNIDVFVTPIMEISNTMLKDKVSNKVLQIGHMYMYVES